MSKQRLTLGSVVALLGYLFVLPSLWYWLPPTATVSIPHEWSYNQDMPVTVVVSSWHSNYKVTEVRLVANPQKTRLEKVNGPFYPVLLLSEQRPRYWSRFKLNPFTYPQKYRMELALPLKSLSSEGKAGPGTLAGNIDVEISHIGAVNKHSSVLGRETPHSSSSRVPFELTLY